jgi:co-chaperonin GroES (HSP10)
MRSLERHVAVEQREKTKGGTAISDTGRRKPPVGREGRSMGRGNLAERREVDPLDLRKGNHVLFSTSAGGTIEIRFEGRRVFDGVEIAAVCE